ncbi:hypothetical protein OE88DRAFT_205190 [Heliocybe sulcata]|uniref:Uncharacterized protein n=1 Tax=Heliocybe sulcata TaxID=5364 RepID=A0A5C3N1F3_9AGAM|nr:hypothetical protein OE88DRAFT_205190 [Heliocybe sulcata]
MADAFATWDGFYTGPPGPYKSSALDKCRSLLKPARYNSIMSSNAASLPEKPAQAPSSEPEPSLAQAPASEPGPEPELVEIRPSHPPEQVPTLADVMAARTQTRVTAAKAQTRIAQTAAAAPPRASSPSPVTSRPISKTKASKEDAFAKKQRELLQRQKKFSKDIATGPKKKAKEKVQQVGEEPPKQRGFLSALFQRWL